ncbi:MAG: hypothetical protein R2822_04290 [Spirosomataceae bacterium]
MNEMKYLLTLYITACMATVAQSQCRPATAQENQAYERVVKELQRQFTAKTPSGDWKLFAENHSMGNLEVTSEWGGFVHLCTDRYDLIMERADIAAARKAELDTLTPATTTLPSLYVPRDTMYRENPDAVAQRANDTYTVSVEMNLGNYRLQDKESARIVESVQNISVSGSPLALEVRLKPDLQGAVGQRNRGFIGRLEYRSLSNAERTPVINPILEKEEVW